MRYVTAKILLALINLNATTQAITESVELTTMNWGTRSDANSTIEASNQDEKETTAIDTFPIEPLLISILAITIVIIIIAANMYFLKKKSRKEAKQDSIQTENTTKSCFAITIPGFS